MEMQLSCSCSCRVARGSPHRGAELSVSSPCLSAPFSSSSFGPQRGVSERRSPRGCECGDVIKFVGYAENVKTHEMFSKCQARVEVIYAVKWAGWEGAARTTQLFGGRRRVQFRAAWSQNVPIGKERDLPSVVLNFLPGETGLCFYCIEICVQQARESS